MQTFDVLFLVMGAVMILGMHAGFAFLEAGTVSRKNQVNAFSKIIFDWATTTVVYFLIGFPVAYGINLSRDIGLMTGDHGIASARFFFLLGFAACIPAIISGGVVGRMRFSSQAAAGLVIGSLIYPVFEGFVWGRIPFMGQEGALFDRMFGMPFVDFAGSVVVHSIGGWLALPAIILLGPRNKRYDGNFDTRPSNIPFLALGSWILIIGWFGFNLMSAQSLSNISGLVAINSLMAMVGGIISGLLLSKNDIGFTYNGALAGLIAVCAGADIFHPVAALAVGAVAGCLFIVCFRFETEVLHIDDVLGVWPLHGINGTWGGIAAGLFGNSLFGAVGTRSLAAQLAGSAVAIVYALGTGFVLYALLKRFTNMRMSEFEELIGSDRVFHNIEAYPEESM